MSNVFISSLAHYIMHSTTKVLQNVQLGAKTKPIFWPFTQSQTLSSPTIFYSSKKNNTSLHQPEDQSGGGRISCDTVSQVERKHLVHSLPEGFSTRVTLIHQGTINEIQIRHQNYTPPSLMRGCHLWRSRQPQLPAVQHLAYEYQLCSGERSVESNASLIVLCNRQPTPSEIY